MSKFEKLIEYVVAEEMDKARALFHDLCVEKSRGIYENLLDEEDLDEAEEVEESDEDLDEAEEVDESDEEVTEEDEIDESDEELEEGYFGEDDEEDEFSDELPADDMMSDIDADEGGMDGDFGDEMGMGGEDDMEDRVVDIESALDELEAKFAELTGEGDMDGDEDDLGMEFDDEEGGEEDMGMDMDDEFEESSDFVREYTEKVSTPSGSKEVGTGGAVGPAGKSPIAQKREKGSMPLNTGEEKGATSVPGSGSFADGMDPKVVGKKIGKGPKQSAPTPVKSEKGASSKSIVPKSHN